ncbi:MAG TPA: type I-B CRISPR-associated protein Cas5 [Thermodesulfobium narugense]|nr:type I-B CRISPR-associated protein Cas5 [Thermodesulfobium narugense]
MEKPVDLLKIKAYQTFANYRKPMSFNFWDTYPLPPLSTVKGWFHAVLDANQYIPLAVSIHGRYDSIVYDLQTLIKFDRKSKAKDGAILLEGYNKALSKSPTYVANLFNVYLTIYIKAEKSHLEKFKAKLFTKEYPSLGRREDLIRIDYVDFAQVQHRSFSIQEDYIVREPLYVSQQTASRLRINGINYSMAFKYNKDLIKYTGLRYFEKRNVVYILPRTIINTGTVLFDQEEDKIVDLIGDIVEE